MIPQGVAFENRNELFYDPVEHLPRLQKVFRLNRHPNVVIWTNRFPVEFLEVSRTSSRTRTRCSTR